jgi:hypothetical protein
MSPIFQMLEAVSSYLTIVPRTLASSGAARALQNFKRLCILLRASTSIIVKSCGGFFSPSLRKEVFYAVAINKDSL